MLSSTHYKIEKTINTVLTMNLLSGDYCIILFIKFRNNFYSKKYFNNFFQCLTYSYKFAVQYYAAPEILTVFLNL